MRSMGLEFPFHGDLMGVALQGDSKSEDKRHSVPALKLAEPNPYCIPSSRGLGHQAYGHTDLRHHTSEKQIDIE